MQRLLIGAAVAALAMSGPVWAQPAPSTAPPPGANAPAAAPSSALPNEMNRMPSGGRSTSSRGTGPATTAMPNTTAPGTPTAAGSAYPSTTNRMPAGGRATSERGTTGSVTRAHHRRHAVQSARTPSAGGQADQLNRQELTQLPGTNPTTMNRMSTGGRATSGGPSQ